MTLWFHWNLPTLDSRKLLARLEPCKPTASASAFTDVCLLCGRHARRSLHEEAFESVRVSSSFAKPFLADLVVLPEAGVLADLGALPEAGVLADLGAAFDLCQ